MSEPKKRLQKQNQLFSKELPMSFIVADQRKLKLIRNHPAVLDLLQQFENNSIELRRESLWKGATELAMKELANVLEALKQYDERGDKGADK